MYYLLLEESINTKSAPPPKNTTTLTTKSTGITNTTSSKHSDINYFDEIMGMFDESNKVVTIASTEDENLTEKDILSFFGIEFSKISSPFYLAVHYATFDDENWYWACRVKYRKNGKTVQLVIRNSRIEFYFFNEPGYYVTTDDGRKINAVDNQYDATDMLYHEISNCIAESKLLLKKHGQAYSGSELEGIEELEKIADEFKAIRDKL
ncbi:hypothetical protein [uncultured Treponema sp.]|uniref:hypothetical protein n=1 Tax=uncultured Treponema sp. TaxID=162155 RepID=UPI002805E3C2|nr:hypothetical protein [uncultured Treponema sp.]